MSLLSRVQHITAACHPIHESHIADTKVTPPEDLPSQQFKAAQTMRGPEEELEKSREELRVLHDNHIGIATLTDEDECNDENYNEQQGAKATRATKQIGSSSCYKTHESSNMAVTVRRTQLTNPRAQSAALHGNTRSYHVHAR